MSGTYIDLGGFNPSDYKSPVDSRLTLHKAEMVTIGTIGKPEYNTGKLLDGTLISFPDVYFCVCLEDGGMYIYNTDNVHESEFGKFRLVEAGGGSGVIPNPPEEPTVDLKSLKISETVFRVDNGLMQQGSGKPTSETEGTKGQLYIDTENAGIYQLLAKSNCILLAPPGTPLPLSLGNCWESVKPEGVEKILSSDYPPTEDALAEVGQLFVDTTEGELYQCISKNTETDKCLWNKISHERGFNFIIGQSSYVPYKVLYASGDWVTPTDVEQKKFYNVVAIALDDNQVLTLNKGLLSAPWESIIEDKTGYTLVSDVIVDIARRK